MDRGPAGLVGEAVFGLPSAVFGDHQRISHNLGDDTRCTVSHPALYCMPEPRTLFDFSDPETAARWRSVNDVVMGGQSTGAMACEDGAGVFAGHVSLDGGGFASARAPEGVYDLSDAEGLQLRVRGDGKQYQLSLYTQGAGSISYRARFTAPPDWQSLTIPFDALAPRFRGRPAPDAPPRSPEG